MQSAVRMGMVDESDGVTWPRYVTTLTFCFFLGRTVTGLSVHQMRWRPVPHLLSAQGQLRVDDVILM